MGRRKGVCCVCGKGRKLTFEHVPPQAAYNEKGNELFNLDDWLKRERGSRMSGGAPQPKGSGLVSICKPCNEYSGTWYVPEFAKLVRAGINLHHELQARWGDDDPDRSLDQKVAVVSIREVRPLPVLKEIVAMILAVNGPEFGQKNPELVEFVLNKDRRGLPEKYRIHLTLFRGPMARFVGLATVVRTDVRTVTHMTEVAYPPFSYLLTIDSPSELPIGDISDWASAGTDERRDVTLDLMISFGHTPYPADYRSRAMVDAEVARNREARRTNDQE